MAEKPARKDPIHYDQPIKNYQQVEIGRTEYWYYSGSTTRFKTEADAKAAWDSFSAAWDKCSKNAEMIRFCKQVELGVASVYGMLKGMEESFDFTIGNLDSAYGQTTEKNFLDEENIEQVNGYINDLQTTLEDDKSFLIDPAVETMDSINKDIKTVGDGLTKYHKTLYSEYGNYRDQVGAEKQNFYEEAEE